MRPVQFSSAIKEDAAGGRRLWKARCITVRLRVWILCGPIGHVEPFPRQPYLLCEAGLQLEVGRYMTVLAELQMIEPVQGRTAYGLPLGVRSAIFPVARYDVPGQRSCNGLAQDRKESALGKQLWWHPLLQGGRCPRRA